MNSLPLSDLMGFGLPRAAVSAEHESDHHFVRALGVARRTSTHPIQDDTLQREHWRIEARNHGTLDLPPSAAPAHVQTTLSGAARAPTFYLALKFRLLSG